MRSVSSLLVLIFGSLAAAPACAEKVPLWEIAVGGGALTIPDYRGAGHDSTAVLPAVVPFYNGKYLRSDEEGVRGELFKTERLRLDFSLDGNVPVKSDDNPARAGMPDLDATAQLGPALNVKLWEADAPDRSLILFLPIRAAFAVDTDRVESIGYTFAPQVTYYRRVPLAGCDWKLGLTGGLQFGSSAFHDYYYSVDAAYTTATRPEYEAKGGFAGYRFIGTFLCRYPRNWISFFARYDRVDGAVFDGSPLVRRNGGLTAGFVVTWMVGRSSKMVEVTDWKYESIGPGAR